MNPTGGAELGPAAYISVVHQKPTLVSVRAFHESAGVIRCGTAKRGSLSLLICAHFNAQYVLSPQF